jgi:hypothetical protein
VLDSLDAPWREVLLLGWEAYDAGTIPVGAVVVDETGAIVSRGRNRIFDEQHEGQLAGSRLADAEVNALIGLPAGRHYHDWTLYSLWRVPDSNVSRFYRRTKPELVEAAATLPPPRSGARVADVAGSL